MSHSKSAKYHHWKNVPRRAWKWPHFKPGDICCRHSGAVLIVPGFMDKLETLRISFNRPLSVVSGYWGRPGLTKEAGGPDERLHATGRAVDFRIHGEHAQLLIGLAFTHGFTGIGVKQHGPYGQRLVHLDDLPAQPNQPRPWLWSYP